MLVSVNAANTGLSPLARGTHYAFLRLPGFCRFIPAGAGNTRVGKSRGNRTPVYPRWRGEHVHTQTITESQNGLSPLARGTPEEARERLQATRFIPAGAGNTFLSALFITLSTVYPRWRGEHSRQHVVRNHDSGLSPLARGTRLTDMIGPRQRRFIPAGAGNTNLQLGKNGFCAVYPRWRGEHRPRTGRRPGSCGLSPLARGTRCRRGLWHLLHRFIPAGAGNTVCAPAP